MHSSESSRIVIVLPLIVAATPGILRLLLRIVVHVDDLRFVLQLFKHVGRDGAQLPLAHEFFQSAAHLVLIQARRLRLAFAFENGELAHALR